MFTNTDIKFYFFTDTLDEIIIKNIKNFKKTLKNMFKKVGFNMLISFIKF